MNRIITISIIAFAVCAVHSCSKNDSTRPHPQPEPTTDLTAGIVGIYTGTLQDNCPLCNPTYDTTTYNCMVQVSRVNDTTIQIQPYGGGHSHPFIAVVSGGMAGYSLALGQPFGTDGILAGNGTFATGTNFLKTTVNISVDCPVDYQTFQGIKQ